VNGPIFVVGYSRSGTKFVCNLIERGSGGQIEHLGELHFFGRLAAEIHEKVSSSDVARIIRLLAEQYARRVACPYDSVESIVALFGNLEETTRLDSRLDVYRHFIEVVRRDRGVENLCDGTPRNAYYIEEILESFPDARIIYMIRDPRDSILSQKSKPAQVRARGDGREATRLALNYNPVLMAKFWASSIGEFQKHEADRRIFPVHYEKLLAEPESTLRKLSDFVECPGLEHYSGLVKTGNSNKYGTGLTTGEIAAIERVTGNLLIRHGYSSAETSRFGKVFVFLWLIRLVACAPLVYLMNLRRFSAIGHEIRKRLLS